MGGTAPADAAQDALLRSLAAETGPQGVRVVGLYTAGVRETFEFERSTNPMLKKFNLTPEGMEQMLGQRTMLGRLPRLAEVADTAAFLASDRASGITGTVVSVTCGLVGTFA